MTKQGANGPSQRPAQSGDGPDAIFKQRLEAGEFEIQSCLKCESSVFFPRLLCPNCGSGELEWVRADGRGTVYSTTTVRRRPENGGDYNVALVDLVEGPRLMTRIEGIAPEEVTIGMEVIAAIVDEEDSKVLVFRLVDGPQR